MALAGISSVVAPGGRLEALVSVVPSDGVAGLNRLDASCEPSIRAAWSLAGLDLLALQRATTDEIRKSGSSWARRLGVARDARRVWRMMQAHADAGRGNGCR